MIEYLVYLCVFLLGGFVFPYYRKREQEIHRKLRGVVTLDDPQSIPLIMKEYLLAPLRYKILTVYQHHEMTTNVEKV